MMEWHDRVPAKAEPTFREAVQAVMRRAAIGGLVLALGAWGGVARAQSADPAPALADPALGMGLIGIADWSVEHPFIDLMKTSRPWVASTMNEWAVLENAELAAEGYLSPEGWPHEFPPGTERFDSLVLTGQPEAAESLAGTYVLRWEGRAEVWLQGQIEDVVPGDGSLTFTYRPGEEGAVIISVVALDPADPFHDMTLVREEDLALFEGGAVFNPDFLARVRDFRALRFMDWMATNGSTQVAWEDRPQVTDATWAPKGVPVEIMVQLANEVGADAWFTMPHLADDAYVAAFASYVRDHLDPRLKVYAEWSNEVWNFLFPQAHWARDQAVARWNVAPDGDYWMQFAGLRAAEVADIWAEAFGDEAEGRLVRVISVWTGYLGLEVPLLESPLAVEEGHRPPVESFDAYAVTGYFGQGVDPEVMAPQLRDWIAAGVADEEMTAWARADLENLIASIWPHHAQVARDHGLRLVAYEGGTHILGAGEAMEDQAITDYLATYSYTPEMASLYRDLLAEWEEVGGTLFMHYADLVAPSKYGSFGALRHLDDQNPRWDALVEANAAPRDWEVRDPAAFLHGVQIRGSEAGETLTGTPEEDDLLGLGGDDVLVAEGGSDRLHGGEGRDRVVLAGSAADWTVGAEGIATILTRGAVTVRLTAVEELLFEGSGEVQEVPSGL